MGFKSQAAEDAANIMSNNETAEMIRYIPYGSTERFINAVVDRKRTLPAGEDGGRTLIDTMEIMIVRHETLGVPMVTKGQDKAILADTIGGPDVTFIVADIIDQDEAAWTLLLRQ